jgi:N-acetylneuraminic acid mutarotase
MNTEDRFDHLLTERLRADAPREAPSGLLDATMSRIAGTQQRSTRWFGGPASRLLAVAAVAVLAVLAGTQLAVLIGRQAGVGPSPSVLVVPSESPEPSPTVAPSAAAILPSATPSASSSPATAAAWTATDSTIEPRNYHTATLLGDGRVLVAGGGGSATPDSYSFFTLATAELYDPGSGSWTATGSMGGGRILHTATVLPDGKVLVAGGADGVTETSVNALASAELYDPSTGSWTATGNMRQARARHTATLLPNGKVLVVGGSGSGPGTDSLASAELYDPMSGTWTATGNLIEARTYHTATLLPDGRVLVAGGSGSSGPQLASAELYDPASGTWTATGNMNGEHHGHTATLLPDGKVLVVGGTSSRGATDSAELYDVGSGTWTVTGSLIDARSDQTATLLPDGRVLVAGGSSSTAPQLASAELYDPSSRSWAATVNMVNMSAAHTGHTATLLPDGNVLVVGGGAELYDPGSRN